MKNDVKKMFNELKREMKETKNKCVATLTSFAFYRIQWMNLIYFIRYRAMIVCLLYALNFILLCYELDKSLGLSKQQLFTAVVTTLSSFLLIWFFGHFVGLLWDISNSDYKRERFCHLVKSFTSYCCVGFVYLIWQKQIPNIQTLDDIPIEFIFTFLSNLVTFLLSTLAIHLFWKRARNHLAVIADYREKREADSIPKRIQDQVILSDYAKQLFVPIGIEKVLHENENQPAYIEGQSAHSHIKEFFEETRVIVKMKWSILVPYKLPVKECIFRSTPLVKENNQCEELQDLDSEKNDLEACYEANYSSGYSQDELYGIDNYFFDIEDIEGKRL
ncbi:hypothetical protein [Enterococcus faecalis]|uniref:hypothetical protein n=1 Tax=Enterococcus faecalis TaxID=1351 RepID=UPI001B82C5DC|nr:hypothetical protein [Enterococcus faecalis]HAP3549806.1 hypothetical protein [Enterococcus faecalis]HBC2896485.1 hypothetical protein [Enterococcus faecalis]